MPTDSPHLYHQRGRELGRSEELLDAVAVVSNRLRAHGVAEIVTLGHLAHRTGADHAYLRRIVERSIDPYRTFEIRRRAGREPRVISSPQPTLMDVQRWILSRILDRVAPHPASYAYQTGRSIRACAEQHVGARWMIKMDLHNFFHSIDERQVYTLFAELGYPSLLALELARLCTRQARNNFPHATRFRVKHQRYAAIPTYSTALIGFVPQGAPTSGTIANLVARPMDNGLAALANAHRLAYTRYADDIVLSGSGPFQRQEAQQLLRKARKEIESCGFVLHRKKTRLVPPGARRIVLGLLVDGDKVRLSKETRARIATHVHGAEKFGIAAHQAARGFTSVLGLTRHIDGLLAFSYDVDPDWTIAFRNRWQQTLQRDASALVPFEISDVYQTRSNHSHYLHGEPGSPSVQDQLY